MAIKIDHKGYALERILNCCGLFEGKSPHPNPLPEGEGTLFGSPDQFRIRSNDRDLGTSECQHRRLRCVGSWHPERQG